MDIYFGDYMIYSVTVSSENTISNIKEFFENSDDSPNDKYLELDSDLEVTKLFKKSGNYIIETTTNGTNTFCMPINKHNSEQLFMGLRIIDNNVRFNDKTI
jgi:hypothetical protein